MKKILLLGAGGFIGSHLTVELSKNKEYKITALDITREKLDDGIRQTAELISSDIADKIDKQVQYVHMDIMEQKNDKELRNLIAENDIIVNMIAICNPALYVSDPILTFQIGFLGNLKICDMCIEFDKRLIQFSTSEVYGKSASIYNKDQEFHFNEETSNLIMGPIEKHRWIYASGKQLLERVIHAYGLKKDFHYSIIRPFNYIGERIDYLPSQKSGNPRVFSNFMDALMTSTSMKVVNGGSQKRCYTYINDATDAHIKIINNENNLCDKQIFNVGTNSNETSIKDLAIQMREIYKNQFIEKNQKISDILEIDGSDFYGEGYDDVDRRLLDNSKLIKLTGWKPKYDLKTMLQTIMKYYVEKVREKK